jgi:hypothetical protein
MYRSCFLDLALVGVVSITPLLLYPRGKSPRCPLDRRLGGPQSRSGQRGEEKILDPTGTLTPTPRHAARSQSLYRLRYPGSLTVKVKVKVKLSLCLTNYALRHEGVWRSGCIDPHFLDLGTSWR